MIKFLRVQLHLPDDANKTNIIVDDKYIRILKGLKFKSENGIEYFLFGKLHPKLKNLLKVKVEDKSNVLQNRAGNLKGKEFEKVNNPKGRIECRGWKQKLTNNLLLPNGDVTICENDYGLEGLFGNLLESSYEEIFESERYKYLIKVLNDDSLETVCRKCDYAIEVNTPLQKVKARWKYGNKFKEALYQIYKDIKNDEN